MAKHKKLSTEERTKGDHILMSLLQSGDIVVTGNEFIGTASDGTKVNIGDILYFFRDSVYSYLISHPSPKEW